MTTLVKEIDGTCRIVIDSPDEKAQPQIEALVDFQDLDEIPDKGKMGVLLEADIEIEKYVKQVVEFPVLAINFPAFADGRGLSLATLLRTRYEYSGEIRAVGDVLPDWTPFMYRSGFNAFELATNHDAETAVQCINRITDHYQGSAREPEPAFRRHTLD